MLITHVPMMQDSMKDTVGNASGTMKVTDNSNAQFYPNEVGGPTGYHFHSLNTGVVFDTNYKNLEKCSLAFWFSPTYVAEANYVSVIGIGDSTQAGSHWFRLQSRTAGTDYTFTAQDILNDGAALLTITKSDYPAGIWMHILVTFEVLDGSNAEIKFYINNELKATTKHSWVKSIDGDLIIGITSGKGTCDISDVRVYNHILSDYERDEIYRKRLVCHYCFDDIG